MTVNKLQGATVQKIICNVDSKSHMDRNKFYVTVSRAKSDVTILTDDIDKLKKNAQEWCHKVTSDDFIHNLEDEIAENQTKTVSSDYKDKFQRAKDLQELTKLSPAIIAERNKIREKYGKVTWDNLPSFSSAFDSLRFAPPATTLTTPKPAENKVIQLIKTEPVVKSPVPSAPKPKKSTQMEQKHSSGFFR